MILNLIFLKLNLKYGKLENRTNRKQQKMIASIKIKKKYKKKHSYYVSNENI